jgi:hypothetical protein
MTMTQERAETARPLAATREVAAVQRRTLRLLVATQVITSSRGPTRSA